MQARNDIILGEALRRLPLFAGLSSEHFDELLSVARRETFQSEQRIYRAGERARDMYILLSGQVKLALSCSRGGEKIIDIIESSRPFGVAELFGSQPYIAEAIAVEPSQLICVSGHGLRRLIAKDARVALRTIQLLAHRQFEIEAELAVSHCCSGNLRLLDFFLSLASAGRSQAAETLVSLTISKQLLASRLGMRPETLSRGLRELSEDDLISAEGSCIRLKNDRIERYLADQNPFQLGILPGLRRWSDDSVNRPTAPEPALNGLRPSCDAINKAGRQRMLSQRMAKSWLMLGARVSARRTRSILKESISLFEHHLQELEILASSAEARDARAGLCEIWQPYRALLSSEPSPSGAQRLFGLSEDVLAAANNLTSRFAQANGTRQGELVNLAGRQRMLSQQMAKLFMFKRMGIEKANCRIGLKRSEEEFSIALGKLVSATPDKPGIGAELNVVAKDWNKFKSAIVRDATGSKVLLIGERLLKRTDASVELYIGLRD